MGNMQFDASFSFHGIVRKVEQVPYGNDGKSFQRIVVAYEEIPFKDGDKSYPSVLPMSAWGKTAAKVAGIREGSVVSGVAVAGGRESDGKYYPDIKVRSIAVNMEPQGAAGAPESAFDEVPF